MNEQVIVKKIIGKNEVTQNERRKEAQSQSRLTPRVV